MTYKHVHTSVAGLPAVLEEHEVNGWQVHTLQYPTDHDTTRVFVLFERDHLPPNTVKGFY